MQQSTGEGEYFLTICTSILGPLEAVRAAENGVWGIEHIAFSPLSLFPNIVFSLENIKITAIVGTKWIGYWYWIITHLIPSALTLLECLA